jgi:hypothetical protein
MADVIAAADLNQRVPRLASAMVSPLMQVQLAAEPNPSRLCPLAPFISADLDQVPFERRKAAENRNH